VTLASLAAERSSWERAGRVVDIHLAGAGVETEEALVAGERVSIAFATPTLWDPLVVTAVVAWAQPAAPAPESVADPSSARYGSATLGKPRTVARAGLRFDYPSPDAVLAMFDMLAAIGFE
jgi:hypothetical protein